MRRSALLMGVLALLIVAGLIAACDDGEATGEAIETPSHEAGSEPAPSPEPSTGEGGGRGEKIETLLAGVQPPRSYQVRSTPPGSEPAMTMIVKMDGKQPAAVKMTHDDGWMLVDMAAGATYAFEPRENMVMKLPLGAGDQQAATSPADYVDPSATTLGVEKVDGVRCWVIESQVGPMKSRVWVGAKDGLPRQFQTDEGITRFAYSRINEIDDSEFALPSGIEVMDMARMMQQGFKGSG